MSFKPLVLHEFLFRSHFPQHQFLLIGLIHWRGFSRNICNTMEQYKWMTASSSRATPHPSCTSNSINIPSLWKNRKVTSNNFCNSETCKAQPHTHLTLDNEYLNIRVMKTLLHLNMKNSLQTVYFHPRAGFSFLS